MFLVLFVIYRRGKVLRSSPDIDMRVYGRTLEGATLLYVAWLFYQSAWQSDTMNFIYWPLAGIFVRLSYQMQADKAYERAVERANVLKGITPKTVIAQQSS
ncbi:MAG: hypothetical protein IPP40_10615 [bacterium]|nr:hypothetical protein [bacterium]